MCPRTPSALPGSGDDDFFSLPLVSRKAREHLFGNRVEDGVGDKSEMEAALLDEPMNGCLAGLRKSQRTLYWQKVEVLVAELGGQSHGVNNRLVGKLRQGNTSDE